MAFGSVASETPEHKKTVIAQAEQQLTESKKQLTQLGKSLEGMQKVLSEKKRTEDLSIFAQRAASSS